MPNLMNEKVNVWNDQDNIESIIQEIRSGYSDRCLEYTGTPLDDEDKIVDRRESVRETLTIPFYVGNVDVQGALITKEHPAVHIAVTRDISQTGIGFQADQVFSGSYFVAEFDCSRSGTVRFLIQLRWFKKKSKHCYLYGGKIISFLKRPEQF